MRNVIEKSGISIEIGSVEKLELSIGHALPSDYRSFLLQYNGGTPKYSCFKTEEVFLDLVYFLTLEEGSVYDLPSTRMHVSDRVNVKEYLPIAETGEGNMAFLSLVNGKIYFWQHDQPANTDSEYDLMVYLSQNFTSFINCLYATPSDETEVDRIGKGGTVEEMNEHLTMNGPVLNNYGHSIGSVAIQNDNLPLVVAWYEQGHEVENAMHIAAMNGSKSVIDFLLERGFDVNALNQKGKTPLDVASWSESHASILKERGAKTSKELSS